jgi:hypothetical protein
LVLGSIATIAALVEVVWLSHRTSQREAAIFASLSQTAFAQGFCDRALRLAVAGLAPRHRPVHIQDLQRSRRPSSFALRIRSKLSHAFPFHSFNSLLAPKNSLLGSTEANDRFIYHWALLDENEGNFPVKLPAKRETAKRKEKQ